MARADYRFYIDWDNDGSFLGDREDVTALARGAQVPVQIQYGRDQARALSPVRPGQLNSLELDNRSRDFSPENTASPLAGNLKSGRPLLIQCTFDGSLYTLYRGFLDGYNPMPHRTNKSVQLSALDVLARFGQITLSTELYHAVQTGEAIGLILDELGWPAGARDIDQGATTIRWWWEEGTDGLTALQRIVAAEGPGALVSVDGDNRFVFRDRHHRLTRTASTTSQATFVDTAATGPGVQFSPPLDYDIGWRDIVNTVDFGIDDRAAGRTEVVWQTDEVFTLGAGETITIVVRTNEPFREALAPVSGTDYIPRSGTTATATISRTSGQATTIELTSVAGSVVTGMQLRAQPVSVVRSYKIAQSDQASIDDYGVRSYPQEIAQANRNDAEAISELILAQRAQRVPIVQVTIKNGDDDRLEQQLQRDLSDRVTVVEPEMGINGDFFIEQIEHTIEKAGASHDTTFGCEKAAAHPDSPATMFIIGSATNGVLGTSVLAG